MRMLERILLIPVKKVIDPMNFSINLFIFSQSDILFLESGFQIANDIPVILNIVVELEFLEHLFFEMMRLFKFVIDVNS